MEPDPGRWQDALGTQKSPNEEFRCLAALLPIAHSLFPFRTLRIFAQKTTISTI
jgi:hypothetical protein